MEIKIPAVGESITEVTIAEWLKKDGDTVKPEEALLSIETEKANVEVVAESGGVLSISVPQGENVAVGAVVGHIQAGGAAASAVAPAASAAEPPAVPTVQGPPAQASPAPTVAGSVVEGTSVPSAVVQAAAQAAQAADGTQISGTQVQVSGPKGPSRPAGVMGSGGVARMGATGPRVGGRPPIQNTKPAAASPVTQAAPVAAAAATKAASAPTSAPAKSAVSPARVASSPATGPAARQAAGEQGVVLENVQGTGPQGRIQKEDVLQQSAPATPQAVQQKERPDLAPTQTAAAAGPAPAAATPTKATPALASTPAPAPATSSTPAPAPAPAAEAAKSGTTKEPMSRLRQTIARRLVESQQRTATLTTFNEVDMSQIIKLREQYRDAFKKRYDVSLGFMGFFTKAVIEALKTYPKVNAFIDGTHVVYNHFYNIGIAVGTDRGLVVPVVREAQNKSLADVELAIRDYATKARAGKIELRDLEGGTFTISNGGVYGSLLSTPILNPPQTGILGLHKIEQRPVAVDGKVEIRPMMYVALSYDHRLIDGTESVQFLLKIKQCIEDPSRLLLEI